MIALGRNQMSPWLVLNWMKSLMVGVLSAARFATRFLTALLWAGGSSRRGFWGDCGNRAVDGSSHGALGGTRRGTDEGFANRGDGVRNCGARLPGDRVLPCPRLRAGDLSVLRVGPLGVDLLGRPRRTPRVGELLLCGTLLPLGNDSCSWRLTSRARAVSFLVRLPRRHGHLLLRKVEPLLIYLQERHLPRTVPAVFGRRLRPLSRAGLDETGTHGAAAPFTGSPEPRDFAGSRLGG